MTALPLSKCDRWVLRQKIIIRVPSLEQWLADSRAQHGLIKDELMLATFRHRYTNYERLCRKLRSRFAGRIESWKIADAQMLLKQQVNWQAGNCLRQLRREVRV